MAVWKNSIVSYIDLIGIQEKIAKGNSLATDTMRKMHNLVENAMLTLRGNFDCGR